jgi:MurNAc alpha-1-phosphate uridylyltransferase
MILAAGLGKRMRPLTDHLPKPLLPVAGQPLIVHHLRRLKAAGFTEVVINVSYLGQMIQDALGDGSEFDLSIRYSVESEPLETAGAIQYALELLGCEPFLLVNGDVWTDCPLSPLLNMKLPKNGLGHLVLVPNPEFKAGGDFAVANGELEVSELCPIPDGQAGYTFSGVSVLSPDLITRYPFSREKYPLLEVFKWAMANHALTAQVYRGSWIDVGTPERLDKLKSLLSG